MKANRFRFRAWDALANPKWMMDHIVCSELTIDGLSGSGLEVMQSTGLLDVDGKEIYEGDIVRSLSSNNQSLLCEVVWRQEEARWGFEYAHNTTFINLSSGCSSWEVVGNIYENPEMIARKET
jgi:uncharacterized phage protein (TIGR01671 family)